MITASGMTVCVCVVLGASASASKGGVRAWPSADTGAEASEEGGSAVLAGSTVGGWVLRSIASGLLPFRFWLLSFLLVCSPNDVEERSSGGSW